MSSPPLLDVDDDDPFKDETPPWLLRRGESINDDGDDGDDDRRRNPKKHSTSATRATTSATAAAAAAAAAAPTSLLDLNRDCLTTILSSLPPASIASAALSCSLLADVARQDALWRMKAVEDFGSKTDVDRWTRRGVANGHALTVRGLAYAIAGHERHHVGILHKRHVAERRRGPAERLVEQKLPRRAREQILAADHLRDLHRMVVGHHR